MFKFRIKLIRFLYKLGHGLICKLLNKSWHELYKIRPDYKEFTYDWANSYEYELETQNYEFSYTLKYVLDYITEEYDKYK